MKKYQVWWRGRELCDVEAGSKAAALAEMKAWHGVKRAPAGTVVLEIPAGYYAGIVRANRAAGFNAGNL